MSLANVCSSFMKDKWLAVWTYFKYMYFSLFTWQQINTPVGMDWNQGFLAGYILMRWKSVCQTPGPSKTTTSKHKMGSILSPSRLCAFRMTPCNQQSQGPYLYLFAASPGFPSSWLSDVSDCRPSAPLHRIRIWIHTWVPTDLHISSYFWLFLARHHLFGSYHCLGKGGFVSLSRTGRWSIGNYGQS